MHIQSPSSSLILLLDDDDADADNVHTDDCMDTAIFANPIKSQEAMNETPVQDGGCRDRTCHIHSASQQDLGVQAS